jgi:hypothetical protein
MTIALGDRGCRQVDAVDGHGIAERGDAGRRRRLDDEVHALVAAVSGDDDASLADDAREHALKARHFVAPPTIPSPRPPKGRGSG